MAWNSSLANSYLASFRPIGPVEGYEKVASRVFTDNLGAIPAANLQAGLEMAKLALGEVGANRRLADELAYKKWLDNETIKQNKRAALRSAGAALAQAFASGFQLPQVMDSRQMQAQQLAYDRAMQQDRNARMLRSSATTEALLKNMLQTG